MKTLILSLLLLITGSSIAAPLSFNAGVTSNYMARGTSQSLGAPGYSQGIDYNSETGIYAGTWTSNVDFGDGTEREYDFWVGYRHPVGKWTFDYCVARYGYIKSPTLIDMYEVKVNISRTWGKWTLAQTVAFSPEYFNYANISMWYETSATYNITPKWALSTAVGYQNIQDGGIYRSYGCFNAGANYKYSDHLSFDLRYFDTNDHGQGKAWDPALAIGFRVTF